MLELAHDRPMSGHLGPGKCKQRVLQSFYWPGVFADVTRHCRSCDICQRTSKRDNVKVPMVKTPIIREPFRKIAIDIVGLLSRTKKGKFLTVIDEGTMYPGAFPLPSIEAERIAQSVVQLFSRVGVARVILSDQGNNFTSTLIKQLYEILGVKGFTTSPYRPQSNGKCERYNGALKKVLNKLYITYEKD